MKIEIELDSSHKTQIFFVGAMFLFLSSLLHFLILFFLSLFNPSWQQLLAIYILILGIILVCSFLFMGITIFILTIKEKEGDKQLK